MPMDYLYYKRSTPWQYVHPHNDCQSKYTQGRSMKLLMTLKQYSTQWFQHVNQPKLRPTIPEAPLANLGSTFCRPPPLWW